VNAAEVLFRVILQVEDMRVTIHSLGKFLSHREVKVNVEFCHHSFKHIELCQLNKRMCKWCCRNLCRALC